MTCVTGWVPLRSRLRLSLACKMFIKETPWDQHPWKGGEGHSSGQRERVSHSVGPKTALAYFTGGSNSRWPFKLSQVGPRWSGLYIPVLISHYMCDVPRMGWFGVIWDSCSRGRPWRGWGLSAHGIPTARVSSPSLRRSHLKPVMACPWPPPLPFIHPPYWHACSIHAFA